MQRTILPLVLVLSGALSAPAPAPAQETKTKFQELIEGKTAVDHDGGAMWNMWHGDQQLLVELKSADLSQEYIVLTSIARGTGMGMVIGGMSWGFGDDVIWTFRKSGEKIYVLRRNVRFRADANSPEATAVEIAYNDSIIYVLPILTTTAGGGDLVDMSRIFMSDDQNIGRSIGASFRFASDRSTWNEVKAFPGNVELEVAAVYSGSGDLERVPDARGVTVDVHYSISELPKVGSNGYKTRVADDRIGYFLTVMKDFSNTDNDEHFVRYINRWNLQPRDASIERSPPREPIVFYVEKTVPVFLRPTVEAGILEWNKAFEAIGFAGAVRVQHEEDVEAAMGVDIDPEDGRYNFFRWITSDAGFAMGPSRVDPRTGQILDADIIFDAGFLESWKQEYETLTAEDAHRLNPNWSPIEDLAGELGLPETELLLQHCAYSQQMQRQAGFAAAVLMGQGVIGKDGELPLEFVHQGLKEVVMHEVGHTLGLRHNFKASTWRPLDDMQAEGAEPDPTLATVASVMDYSPANITPRGVPQGLYYSQTLGPYDFWAIEYGYKTIKSGEAEELAKIAARSGEPGLDYATDEDTRSSDADPLSNRFDLGADPIAFARRQMRHADEFIPGVVDRSVEDGQGYQRARQAFGVLMSEYWQSAQFAARFPGGVYVNRDHRGDAGDRSPFVVVEPEKQREAMRLILDSAFAAPEYDGTLLNQLAASRWNHWGVASASRLDYPIHDTIETMQTQVLSQLLSSTRLQRILDNEYKAAADDDAYTLAEHMQLLVDGVFSEVRNVDAAGEFSNRAPYIDSFRRNLQRSTLRRLAGLVTGGTGPSDARTLARMQLTTLGENMTHLLNRDVLKLDDYSRAHLLDMHRGIEQALNAEVSISGVN